MFRHLVLVRHATAEDRDGSKEDFARALTERGQAQAKTLAQLSQLAGAPKPDLVFTSGYRRAEETLRCFFTEDDVPVVRDGAFAPDGGLKRGLALIFEMLEKYEVSEGGCVWIVGHNPHLELLLEELAPRVLANLGAVAKGTLIWLDWERGRFGWGEEPRLRMALPKPKPRTA